MNRSQIFTASGALAYLDALGARWFAGQWEAAIFAALAILSLGMCYAAALQIEKK